MTGLLLLFSGGLDSTALAAKLRPEVLLFVDYGQRPAAAERRAAEHIAGLLDLPFQAARLGISEFGSGLLLGESNELAESPSPEWWPFRNQFLATAGAARALSVGCDEVALGSVQPDGERHLDGTPDFYAKMNAVTQAQEGGIRVSAPGLSKTTEDLIREARIDESILGWTVSCHRSNEPCGACPGCWKRQRVLGVVGIDGYSE